MILQTNNAGLFGRFVGQVSTIASVVGGSYRPVVLLNDPEVNGRVVARSGFISAGRGRPGIWPPAEVFKKWRFTNRPADP